MSASPGPSNSISAFMLDSRASAPQMMEEERQREKSRDEQVEKYIHETRLWRVANSAQWVAWGVVQAKVPGLEEEVNPSAGGDDVEKEISEVEGKRPEGEKAEGAPPQEQEDDEEDEFDYLSYAHERAMFFWGDLLQMGIVKEEELPKGMLEMVKVVRY